jgi:hypothetical protein
MKVSVTLSLQLEAECLHQGWLDSQVHVAYSVERASTLGLMRLVMKCDSVPILSSVSFLVGLYQVSLCIAVAAVSCRLPDHARWNCSFGFSQIIDLVNEGHVCFDFLCSYSYGYIHLSCPVF